jgi:hypothetical protein
VSNRKVVSLKTRRVLVRVLVVVEGGVVVGGGGGGGGGGVPRGGGSHGAASGAVVAVAAATGGVDLSRYRGAVLKPTLVPLFYTPSRSIITCETSLFRGVWVYF